jgi:PAS domain S-box-containing protein
MAENATGFDGVPWQLIDALPAAIYVTDPAGRITYFNEAAAALWGHRPKLHSDRWCGSWRLYGLDGTPMPHDQCPMAIALKQGRAIRGGQAIAERPDGTLVPFMAFPTPLRDAQRLPSFRAKFENLRLNRRVDANVQFISDPDWMQPRKARLAGERRQIDLYMLDLARNYLHVANEIAPLPPAEPQIFR